MIAEAGVLNEPTLLIPTTTGQESKTKLGRWPRTAHPMDERVYPRGWKPQHPAESRRDTERTKYDVVKRLGRAPFVSMVQATQLGNGNDTTVLRFIYGSRLRGIFPQG